MSSKVNITIFLLFCLGMMCPSLADNRIDRQRPDAPELAAYGQYAIGVRTLEVVNSQQIDVVNIDVNQTKDAELPLYDRPLTLEIWYPAKLGSQGKATLDAYIRDGKTQVELHGKAVRDALPDESRQALPLVLISHGYPGNRYLLSPLAENIASKGYVVVSIDHTDSTYRSKAAFSSTLVNRPVDQLFVLNQIGVLAQDPSSFLYQRVDTENTALVGYSMGGYGAVINAGAGLSEQATNNPMFSPAGTLQRHQMGFNKKVDARLKTVIAFAPWGMNYQIWSSEALQNVSVPMLLIAGSQDDVSGYENGVRAIWQGITGVDRALLTYENANHSAGAPMPAPQEAYKFDEELGFNVSEHYIDAVWDNVRMNNIAQHFVTVWLNRYLKNDVAMEKYLQLVPDSNAGNWAKDGAGQTKPEHSYWHGFARRTAKGLRFERLAKQTEN
ncbi:MAG: dienelactone hydrolase [Paraglaciecola sp.]|nr:dienelactone hydrolase [Paraglaciecola sp.]NCT49656.1 dienelactone hydrolase [Paraglaciecola sp.]